MLLANYNVYGTTSQIRWANSRLGTRVLRLVVVAVGHPHATLRLA